MLPVFLLLLQLRRASKDASPESNPPPFVAAAAILDNLPIVHYQEGSDSELVAILSFHRYVQFAQVKIVS